MGYSLYIKKNIILKSDEVQVNPEISSILGNDSDITLSKTIFDLSGWDVAELFNDYRPDGTNEIEQDALQELLEEHFETTDFPQLNDGGHNWVFYTFFESY